MIKKNTHTQLSIAMVWDIVIKGHFNAIYTVISNTGKGDYNLKKQEREREREKKRERENNRIHHYYKCGIRKFHRGDKIRSLGRGFAES
jgi:hypothetical protein